MAPFIPQIYRTMAFCYASLKQYGRAIENLKIYLLLYPEAPDAREMKDQIYKWEILQEKKGTKQYEGLRPE
ncbi:MAG: tetratricopeptide repeat protein [Candidatus Saccharicenans sp.]|nr:tetratricopeptide repeat protein [Candidatus Saccharicenans sp.]